MNDTDTTFNAAYVEIVALGEHSITDILGELARDHRQTGAIYRVNGNETLATAFASSALAYEHALSLVDLAFDQALARVARQVSA